MSKFDLLAEKAMLIREVKRYPDAIVNIRHKARIQQIETLLNRKGL
tara:strand:+ start:8999 stop:9136 length:138 start_codon:yes stop_codon:yes gene_type:complete